MPKLFRTASDGEEIFRLSHDRSHNDSPSNGHRLPTRVHDDILNTKKRTNHFPLVSNQDKNQNPERNNNLINKTYFQQDIPRDNPLLSSIKAKTRVGVLQNFQFPDDISLDQPNLRNLLSARKQVPLRNHQLEISATPDQVDVDLQDDEEDIMKMAAQRDQRRGSMRSARGMMGPVLSKTTNSLHVPMNRSMIKQRSESSSAVVGSVNEYATRHTNSSSGIPVNQSTYDMDYINNKGIVHPKGFPRKREHNNNQYSPRRDIMNQSIQRHNLKQFRSSLTDLHSNDLGGGNDFTILKTDQQTHSPGPWNPNVKDKARDDIQILNLHGFMDGIRGSSSMDTQKRVKSKPRSNLDNVPGRSTSRLSKLRDGKTKRKIAKKTAGFGMDDEEDVVLKDIDYIEDKVSSMILDGKVSRQEYKGKPIVLEQAVALRVMLTGNPSTRLSKEWMTQSFVQNQRPSLPYGLVQKKGGPCGVLASVQAQMMKNLIFGSNLSFKTSPASPLRPSSKEWSWALTTAMAEILARIGNGKVTLALPGSFAHFSDYGGSRYSSDGLTETLFLHEVSNEAIVDIIKDHLSLFTSEKSSGCVLFLYSALLTRGIDSVNIDMDAGGGHLINAHGYASQEVVNLFLTGQATTNTFDGDHTLSEEGSSVSGRSDHSRMTLKGVQKQSELGLLSLFEHYGSCKVGKHLKSPEFPVWVMCSESHYSVIFSRDKGNSSNNPPDRIFDVYYYDGLAMLDEEVRLTIDLDGDPNETDPVPPLELCIRTKWPRSAISWNGTDPIL